ncbi:MAG: hypothetical protein VX619_00430 [bacterium]|nr:hypothetical protein [bacterium]
MSPLNLILFCNQPYLKGDPLNSWVFDDIAETSYLQIILDRWIASERVNKIFLLADSLELAKKLEKYESERVVVKLMSHKNHRPLGMSDAKIYNIDLGQQEYIASWIYQIMYQYGKGVFFVDSIVRGHVNFDQLDRIHEKFGDQPGHCYTIVGPLGLEGRLLDFSFVQSCVSEEQFDGLQLKHPKALDYGHLYNYCNEITNRSLITMSSKKWDINSRKRWKLFHDYYVSKKEENSSDILASFLEYFSKNKLDSDLMHVQLNCSDSKGYMDGHLIEQLIENCKPFGRLTIELKNLDKHPAGGEIVRKLKLADLHLYVSINGNQVGTYYDQVFEYSDVINFELLAHSPEFHAKRFPEDDANLIFQNFMRSLLISQKYQKMAVGVTYYMPDDVSEACQAIIFFRERQSINPFFDTSDSRPGLQKPHIEFLRIIPKSTNDYDLDFDSKTLCIDSKGQYQKGGSCFNISFEDYIEQSGFDKIRI